MNRNDRKKNREMETKEKRSPVTAAKQRRDKSVMERFREWKDKVGRTAAYYRVCEECGLSYATVVGIVKRMEGSDE